MKASGELKQCPKCNETKAVTEFSRDRQCLGGLACWCRMCISARQKAYRTANADLIRAKKAMYYRANAETLIGKAMENYEANREHVLAMKVVYHAANRERILPQKAAYRAANTDNSRAWRRAYRARHSDRMKAAKYARRIRQTSVDGTITANEWTELVNAFGRKCLCCGATDKKLTMDHVIPLARGGVHSIANVQPLCLSCNSRKNVREVDYRCP
jgi:5-methylcytosine-specific restriction endonuclease McrA